MKFSITFFGLLDFSLKICKIHEKIRFIYPLNFCFQSPFILWLIKMVNIHNFRLNVLFGIFQWKNLNMNKIYIYIYIYCPPFFFTQIGRGEFIFKFFHQHDSLLLSKKLNKNYILNVLVRIFNHLGIKKK
jgi:hypothetical protein